MLQLPEAALVDPFCTRFRVKGQVSAQRHVVVAVDRPGAFVYHREGTRLEYAPIQAELAFGLAQGHNPLPGDSERLVTIRATSLLPIRFVEMSVAKATGESALLTTFPDYVLNVSHVCAASEFSYARTWLLRNLDLILDGNDVAAILRTFCAQDGHILWVVVPSVDAQDRKRAAPFSVSAEFAMCNHVSIS